MSNDTEDDLTLEQQLGADDWAIIIGKDGNLRGLFIPDGSDDTKVPHSLLVIMQEYFGVDFDDEEELWATELTSETIH